MNDMTCSLLILAACLQASSHACTWRDSPVRCHNGFCTAGQFYNTDTQSCQSCPKRSYMAADGHNCSSCVPCTVASKYNHEVVVNPCTEMSDTKLGCEPGYFRTVESRDFFHWEFSCWSCSKCKKGEKAVKKCTDYSNTECRPLNDDITAELEKVSQKSTGYKILSSKAAAHIFILILLILL